MIRTVVIFFFAVVLVSSEIVEIDNGKINGLLIKSTAGKSVLSFSRIPYAVPPINELRFQAPLPAKNWEGVFDGTKGPVSCFQTTQERDDIPMTEDCLHINIFTKNLTDVKPVVVWIHSGAFETGSGAVDKIPELLNRDVVLVTFNYRLASLGFLAMGSKEVPGNAGMKDQVMALRWIQKNIEKFGGNKNLVTLLGLSSGGISVTAHLASPMSTNLFQRAFAMSGAITMKSELRKNNLGAVEKLGNILKCSGDVLECLKKAPAKDLMRQLKDVPSCQILYWLPVIEDDFGQERFLIEDPAKSFRKGNYNKAPVIAGRAEFEFEPLLDDFSGFFMKDFYFEFNILAPKCFNYWENKFDSNKISRNLRQKFLLLALIDKSSSKGMAKVVSDGFFGYPIYKFVESISSSTDVYFYFSPGLKHGDELEYFTSTSDRITSSNLMRIIEHFALKGNPNFDTEKFQWGKYESKDRKYLELNRDLKEKSGLSVNRYQIWDKLLEFEEEILEESKEISGFKPLDDFLTFLARGIISFLNEIGSLLSRIFS